MQVEHPNTDHTVYKVAVGAKDEVPDFSPPIPDPAIFQKGAEFRDWLLMKALNAEFNCHQASSFKKLAVSEFRVEGGGGLYYVHSSYNMKRARIMGRNVDVASLFPCWPDKKK